MSVRSLHDPALARKVQRGHSPPILDRAALERLHAEFEVDVICHLAALLSTRSEFSPVAAHDVNVQGTLNLLEFAQHEAESHGRPVTFLYPSSIAAYGLPSLDEMFASRRPGPRGSRTQPATIRVQQAYCEQLGRYYSRHLRNGWRLSGSAAGSTFAPCGFPG